MSRGGFGIAAALIAAAIGACSGPRPLPKGPPPEYEEPPMPSWMRDAGAPSATEPARVPAPLDAG